MKNRHAILAFAVALASTSAHALVIETTLLDNAYIEVLPNEPLNHGGWTVVPAVEGVVNPDPIRDGAPAEEEDDVRTTPGSSLYGVSRRIRIADIDVGAGRVYRLDPEAGELSFGDGEPGARPPTDGPSVSAYRFGGGNVGNIGDSFLLDPQDLQPFLIPLAAFDTDDHGKPDYRFVLSGLTAIELSPTEGGLLVFGFRVAGVPEPGAWALLVAGLAGLALARRRRIRP